MIYHGDLFDVLPTLPEASIDACATDPPYGLGFMGKRWDTFKPGETEKRINANTGVASENPNLKNRVRSPATSPASVEYDRSLEGQREFQAWTERWAREVFRVLKPGAHMLVCGAPRSHHRMASGLEDAGFEIRDCFAWLFGSGFPKSLNLGQGRGTALKPAHEPIVVARKPFKGSLTANLEQHGTGALNIDACRIGFVSDSDKTAARPASWPNANDSIGTFRTKDRSHYDPIEKQSGLGRWPANVVLDEDAAAMLDEQSGVTRSPDTYVRSASGHGVTGYGPSIGEDVGTLSRNFGDVGGASRFYYVAKPSRSERDEGCFDLSVRQRDESRKDGNPGGDNPRNRGLQQRANHHPTVKPVELMRWLVRLITPPGGTVLDCFMGSGTTGMACAYELRPFIGIEREAEYVEIARRRIASVAPLFSLPSPESDAFVCGRAKP